MKLTRHFGMLALIVLSAALSMAAEPYRLGTEDVLTVSVYGHDELAREVVVLTDGRFSYPIVGAVEAAGRTPDEVADAIRRGLSAELADPRVTVSVKTPAARRVYAGGLVTRPGSFDLKPGWRVSHLLAESGGLTVKPEVAKAVLVRGRESLAVSLSAVLSGGGTDADPLLQTGDLLQVQADTNLIHVAGEVRNPGDYNVKSSLGVVEAVAMAGGPTPTAALSRAHIVRSGNVIRVNLHRLLVAGETDGNVAVMPGDTLVVPQNQARIAVLGAVQQPGYYDLPDGKSLTVAECLGLARGPARNARVDRVALVRPTGEGKPVSVTRLSISAFIKKGDVTQNPSVLTGDVVYVPDGKEQLTAANLLTAATLLATPFIYGAVD